MYYVTALNEDSARRIIRMINEKCVQKSQIPRIIAHPVYKHAGCLSDKNSFSG